MRSHGVRYSSELITPRLYCDPTAALSKSSGRPARRCAQRKQLLHDFIIILMKSLSRDRTMNGYECSFYFAALSTSYLFNESTSLASRDTNIES